MGSNASRTTNQASATGVKLVSTRSMNWPKFVSMRKELNEKCKRIVDSEDCYLQFCVKRGSDECLIWKLTTDVLVVKINRTLKKSVSMRIVSLREWVSIYNSIMFTVDVSEPRDEESCSASTMNSNMWKSSVVSGTTNDDGTCLICFDRYPDTMLSCMHAFCHICVEKVKNSGTFLCPLCRTSLNENDNEDLWSIPDFPEASDIDNYLVSIAREKRSPVRNPEGSSSSSGREGNGGSLPNHLTSFLTNVGQILTNQFGEREEPTPGTAQLMALANQLKTPSKENIQGLTIKASLMASNKS